MCRVLNGSRIACCAVPCVIHARPSMRRCTPRAPRALLTRCSAALGAWGTPSGASRCRASRQTSSPWASRWVSGVKWTRVVLQRHSPTAGWGHAGVSAEQRAWMGRGRGSGERGGVTGDAQMRAQAGAWGPRGAWCGGGPVGSWDRRAAHVPKCPRCSACCPPSTYRTPASDWDRNVSAHCSCTFH